MTLRGLIVKATKISANQTVLDLTRPVLEFELVFHPRTNLDGPVLNEITDVEVDRQNRIIYIGVIEK